VEGKIATGRGDHSSHYADLLREEEGRKNAFFSPLSRRCPEKDRGWSLKKTLIEGVKFLAPSKGKGKIENASRGGMEGGQTKRKKKSHVERRSTEEERGPRKAPFGGEAFTREGKRKVEKSDMMYFQELGEGTPP